MQLIQVSDVISIPEGWWIGFVRVADGAKLSIKVENPTPPCEVGELFWGTFGLGLRGSLTGLRKATLSSLSKERRSELLYSVPQHVTLVRNKNKDAVSTKSPELNVDLVISESQVHAWPL
jgi:hypothetical protein